MVAGVEVTASNLAWWFHARWAGYVYRFGDAPDQVMISVMVYVPDQIDVCRFGWLSAGSCACMVMVPG